VNNVRKSIRLFCFNSVLE